MTQNIRTLLAQIADFQAMNAAGLTPLPGDLVKFFETAQLARLDVRAWDTGLRPGEPAPAPRAELSLDRVQGEAVEILARVPLPVVARAVLEQLEAAGDGPKRIRIGGGPCGA